MKRRMFSILSALSLLMGIATCVAWVRSYHVMDQLRWQGNSGLRSVASASGYAELALFQGDWSGHPADAYGVKYRRDQPFHPFNELIEMDSDPADKDFFWRHGGFGWCQRREARGNYDLIAYAPFWSLAILWSVLPLAWTTARWRSAAVRRKGLNLCRSCGYDLRATPGRCPECGRTPEDSPRGRGGR